MRGGILSLPGSRGLEGSTESARLDKELLDKRGVRF